MCLLCGGVHYCVQLLSWGEFVSFFQTFPLLFLCSSFFYFLIFCSLDHLKVRNFLSLEIILWSTIVWFVLRGPLLCPAASWGDFVSNISFTFSFAKVFSFTFLASFMWTSQKFPISQNIWYLIKTQLKNITQTIFQGGSPWATLIHNSMVCLRGPLLCPAVSWGYFFSNMSFTFSFAKVFSFTFLVSFMWTSQKCPISQNIGYLIKTQLKNSTQTIFKGVVHEQPWSTIVWFVWGVHYCAQRLPEVFCFKQSLYLFLCY